MTPPEPEGLKPCPFCGETPDVNDPHTFRTTQGGKWGNVACCCCDGPEVRTSYNVEPDAPWHADAIAEWNRRARPEERAGEKCAKCGGSGSYASPEHDPRCDGSCNVGCPVPVETQCEECGGIGLIQVPSPATPARSETPRRRCGGKPGMPNCVERWNDHWTEPPHKVGATVDSEECRECAGCADCQPAPTETGEAGNLNKEIMNAWAAASPEIKENLIRAVVWKDGYRAGASKRDAEIEHLKSELRLASAPHESVGAVMQAKNAEIGRLNHLVAELERDRDDWKARYAQWEPKDNIIMEQTVAITRLRAELDARGKVVASGEVSSADVDNGNRLVLEIYGDEQEIEFPVDLIGQRVTVRAKGKG